MSFTLEFYEDQHGDQPVLRWLREELTPIQRRAIGVHARDSPEEGVGVCRGPYGKQLSGGVFEFRLRHDAAEILQALGRRFHPEPGGERILLRVFWHAHAIE